MENQYFDIQIFYISNLVAKAPGLKLGKKSSNFLSNCEALNQQPKFCIFFPSQNNGLEKFMFPNVKNVLKFQNKKNEYNTALSTLCYNESFRLNVKKRFLYSNIFINSLNAKKLQLSYKFINKKCHDMIYLDCE